MVINILAHLHLSHDLQVHGLRNQPANHHCHSIRFLLRLSLVVSPVAKAGEDSEQQQSSGAPLCMMNARFVFCSNILEALGSPAHHIPKKIIS